MQHHQSPSHSPATDWKKQDTRNIRQIIDQGLRSEPYDFAINDIHGIPLYTKQFDHSPCIHIRIGFGYGAIHDELGKEGTAHFLEHMLFDGSNMFADEKETQEFSKAIMLDTLNAYTGLFELCITGKTLPHHFETAITGIFSMINHPLLTEKSFNHEKKVITQEAWGKFLNETRIAYLKKEKANTLYDLPDRLRTGSALGWPETVLAITHEDIMHAHQTYFVRENMEIYVAGNIESIGGVAQITALLTPLLDETKSGTKAHPPYVPSTIGAPKVAIFDHTFDEVGLSERQQTLIDISAILPRRSSAQTGHATDISPDMHAEYKHVAALKIASDLLGELVFRKLRLENSWCYGAGASMNITPDYLSLSVGSSIDKHHTDEALSIIWSIVDDLLAGQFKDDFEKTKILAIDNTLAQERTTGKILDTLVEDRKLFGRIFLLRTYLEYVSEVTYEEVQEVVRTYIRKDVAFTEIIRPSNTAGSTGESTT